MIKFLKEYTKEDFKTDFKYFGGMTLFIFTSYTLYIILYYFLRGC